MQDLGNTIDFSKWPQEIPQPKGKQKVSNAENELHGSGHFFVEEAIEDLELDDRHAEFLNHIDLQEEDEVEKLLGKVAEHCEEFAVDFTNAQDDVTKLFNQVL